MQYGHMTLCDLENPLPNFSREKLDVNFSEMTKYLSAVVLYTMILHNCSAECNQLNDCCVMNRLSQ